MNRQIRLKSRPIGAPTADNFEAVDAPMPSLGDPPAAADRTGGAAGPAWSPVLRRTLWLSLDPYMRGRMSDGPSYAAPVAVGDPMCGHTVSEVVESQNPAFRPGDIVAGYDGWQEFAVSNGADLRTLDRTLPVSTALSVLGMPGLTAYVGLLDIGQPKRGETVVVSAASGAVGSVVGQLAKIRGCRAVGIAGGSEKCRYVTQELGFDACVDYRTGNLAQELKAACPKGIDVNFENVGGEILDTVLLQMNVFGRIALCGLISGYNATEVPPGPKNIRAVLTQRLKMQGLIVFDWADRVPEAIAQLGQWHKEGKLRIREDVREGGVDAFPEVLNLLYSGGNLG